MMLTTSKRVRISEGMIIIALILLLIYGADVAVGKGKVGFLPMNEFTRGISLGLTSIVLSILAFIISLGMESKLTSILLIINGVLIAIGGVIASSLSSSSSNPSNYGVLIMGIVILIMGIIKASKKL